MLRPDPVPGTGVWKSSVAPPAGLLGLALLAVAISAATILGALAFEHIGGYQPCALCLMQRTPYYLGIPIAAVAALAIAFRWNTKWAALLLGLFALLMLYNAGLAAYHSGVEWRFWEGPASCAPTVGVSNVEDMLDQLENQHPPSCTDAAWRFLGLSFAGWNFLIAAFLAALAVYGARKAWRAVR